MLIVFAIVGFIGGVSIGSAAMVLALTGRGQKIYWSVINRRPIIALLTRLSIILSIIACGVMFAYFGHMLAE